MQPLPFEYLMKVITTNIYTDTLLPQLGAISKQDKIFFKWICDQALAIKNYKKNHS